MLADSEPCKRRGHRATLEALIARAARYQHMVHKHLEDDSLFHLILSRPNPRGMTSGVPASRLAVLCTSLEAREVTSPQDRGECCSRLWQSEPLLEMRPRLPISIRINDELLGHLVEQSKRLSSRKVNTRICEYHASGNCETMGS